MAEGDFEQHRVQWNREKVVRFWNYHSALPWSGSTYASNQMGDALLQLLRKEVPVQGRDVLDFGSGPGYLTEKLTKRGARTHAADFSQASLDAVRARVGNDPKLNGLTLLTGLPSSLPTAGFDVAFFIETIEHLLPDDLEATLVELHRVVKPGGLLVTTTRNEEDLEKENVLCPDCGAVFHRIQHLTSWSAASLSAVLDRHGFDRVTTKTVLFRPFKRFSRLWELLYSIAGVKKVNLVYVGRKR